MTKSLEALIATTKADIAKRKAMPNFGDSVDGNIQRLNAINETKASFSLENVEALIAALEQAQQRADVYDMLREDCGLDKKGIGLADFVDWQAKRIAELEARPLCVKLPDGLVMVPTEITKSMQDAWDSAPNGNQDDDENVFNAYRAMIAAAPKP